MVCSLYNAPYTVNIAFENGIQTINGSNYSRLGEVTYPIVNASTPSNLTQSAHSAYFWAFSNQIIRFMGLVTEKLANGSDGDNFSQIQTGLKTPFYWGAPISMYSSTGNIFGLAAPRNAAPPVSEHKTSV
jgi:hypothetical protein